MQPCPSNVTNESDMAYYDKQWWDEFRRAEVDEILRLTGNW